MKMQTSYSQRCLQLYGTDGITEVGAIHKKYRGFLAEAMTTADMFSIRSKTAKSVRSSLSVCSSLSLSRFLVPLDMDVKMKAVALGALFLIVRLCVCLTGCTPLNLYSRILRTLRNRISAAREGNATQRSVRGTSLA